LRWWRGGDLPPPCPPQNPQDLGEVSAGRRGRKRADPAADVSAWEREIDRLVYALYGLTEKEIAVVEGR